MRPANLKQVTWARIAKDVKRVNPELYKIINELSPSDEYPLYLGDYPYGYQILKQGKLYVPVNDHESLPIDDPSVPKQIQEDLAYNAMSNPVSLLLDKSIEIFLDKPSVATPVVFMFPSKGSLMSTSRIIVDRPQHPPFLWNMTSGARSIFMLPKIAKSRMYKRIRSELNIGVEPPSSPHEHWQVFKEIAGSEQATPWSTKILYFSENWFNKLEDPTWKNFKDYLFKRYQLAYDNMGNIHIWDMIFNLILKQKNLKPNMFINNVVRHLFQIGICYTPGLAPAINDEAAPIEFLQKIFLDIYDLKDYIPTIMTPSFFDPYVNCKPVYYSLLNPGLLDTPKKRDNSSQISDLYDIFSLLSKYKQDIKNNDYNIAGTNIHEFSTKVRVSALHSEPENYSQILPAAEELKKDIRFKQSNCLTENYEIASHGALFKGCFCFSHPSKEI